MIRRAGCVNCARPDLWGAGEGNFPGLPDWVLSIQTELLSSLGMGFSVEGENPLGYGTLPDRMTRDEVAALTPGTGLPDAFWQLVEFFRSPPRRRSCLVCPGGLRPALAL